MTPVSIEEMVYTYAKAVEEAGKGHLSVREIGQGVIAEMDADSSLTFKQALYKYLYSVRPAIACPPNGDQL